MSAPLTRWSRLVPVAEGHAVTEFELFFDLVYVFAATQVVGFVVEAHTPLSLVQATLVLLLLWWSWTAYTWLGNQARADEGLVRAGMTVAMVGLFAVALAIPHAWEQREEGLSPALLLVVGYALVRAVHWALFMVAAGEDHELRRQLRWSGAFLMLSVALLMLGALLGGPWQLPAWGAALLADVSATYVSSRGGSWRVRSASHWAERFGLVIILVLGESVVAVGTGVGNSVLGLALLSAAVLGVGLSVAMWWLHFDVVSLRGARALENGSPDQQVGLAIDAYTYLHFPLFAAVIFVAVGVEEIIAHAGQTGPLGALAASALAGGAALYVLAHSAFLRRVDGAWGVPRLVVGALLVAAAPAVAVAPPLLALGVILLVLVILIASESVRNAPARAELRTWSASTP